MDSSSVEYSSTVSVFQLINEVWTPLFEAQWLLLQLRIQNFQLWLELHSQSLPDNTANTTSAAPLLQFHIRHTKEWLVVAEDYVEFVTSGDTSVSSRYGFYFETPEATTSTTSTIQHLLSDLSTAKPPPPPVNRRRRSLAEFVEVEQLTSAVPAPENIPPPPPVPPPMTTTENTSSRPTSHEDHANISLPVNVNHKLKVTFDAKWSRYVGLPVEWKSYNKQFGVPLHDLPKIAIPNYSHSIPTLLVMLHRLFVSLGGPTTVGIFRLAPDKDQCQVIKEAINEGEFCGEGADVHIIANLIKVFFRELPEGIFNSIATPSIYKLAEASLSTVIDELPSILPDASMTASIIYYLLDIMAEVVMHEAVNKMSARNMAIVVSPNLYSVSTENPMVALTTAQKVADFTTNILLARLQTKYNYSPSSNA